MATFTESSREGRRLYRADQSIESGESIQEEQLTQAVGRRRITKAVYDRRKSRAPTACITGRTQKIV